MTAPGRPVAAARLLAWALAAAAALGCGRSAPLPAAAPAAPSTASPAQALGAAATPAALPEAVSDPTGADPTPSALQALLDADLPVQFAALGAFLRATAACPLGEVDVEPSCPQLRQYAEARRKLAVEAELIAKLAALGRAELAHPAPTVRLLAFQLATTLWPPHQAELLQVIDAEADPKVQRAQLHFAFAAATAVGTADDPSSLAALAEWTLERLDRWRGPAHQAVRLQAVERLARAVAVELPEQASRTERLCAAVGEALRSPVQVERAVACLTAAQACPAQASAHLGRADLPDAEAQACASGLLAGWCQAPGYPTANRQAYQGFLQELRRPSSAARPAFALLQRLSCARPLAQAPQGLSAEALAWRARVGFADVAALRAALVRIAESDQANGFARAEAVRTARDLGVSPAQLQAWRRRWGAAEFGVEGQLRRALAP